MTSMSLRATGKLPQTIGYYGALIAFGLTIGAIGPALPSLAASTGSDLRQIGVIFSARAFGFFLGASLISRIFDSVPGHPVMGGALVLMAILAALMPSIPSLWLLSLIFVVFGVAVGLLNVGGNTLISWIHRDAVGPWLNGMHFVNGVGSFFAPILITQVVTATGGIAWAFRIIALLMLLPAGWLFFVQSPAIFTVVHTDRRGAFDLTLILTISLVFLLYVGSEIGFSGWIYSYATTLHPGFTVPAGYLTASFWGALSVGRLFAIPASARFTPQAILIFDFLGCLVGSGLVFVGASSFSVLVIGTVIAGLAMASVFPTLLAFMGRRMELSGRVTGWFFAATSLGGMSIPWVMGQLFESRGPRWTMGTLIVTLSAAASIFTGIALTHRASD